MASPVKQPSWFTGPSVPTPTSRSSAITSAEGHAARRAADRERGVFLTHVHQSKMSVWQALGEADRRGGALSKVPLTRILIETGESRTRAVWIPKRVVELTGEAKKTRGPVNVSWMCDKKVGGNRLLCLAEVLSERGDVPWPGFPFVVPPFDVDEVASAWTA